MDVAGLFLEPHPSNLVRNHFFLSCKNTEIFVVIFQVVSNLAKISVGVPSIPWGVLAQSYFVYIFNFFKLDFFSYLLHLNFWNLICSLIQSWLFFWSYIQSCQGLLTIWTEHSHWFLLNWKPVEISQQKFQQFYN